MELNHQKLKKLVKLMQSMGVLTLKTSEVELSLSPSALHPEPKRTKKESNETEAPTPTEEDILFWSAPGAPSVGDDVA